jgi:S-DNA-T family DNA segregation ATPase FtsK/SpoIIIE
MLLPMKGSDRSIPIDLTGISLTALSTFLFVALATHHPGDPLGDPVWPINRFIPADQSYHPINSQIHNACGWFGAVVSAGLLHSIGVAAYLFAATPAIAAYRLFRFGPIPAPGARSCGWTVTLLALATAASEFRVRSGNFPIVGAGGHLGAMASSWLHEHFAVMGAYILIATLLLFGMLLWTDYWLLVFTSWVTTATATGSRKSMRLAGRVLKYRRLATMGPPLTKKTPITDLFNIARPVPTASILSERPLSAEEAAVAVKIRGRAIETPPSAKAETTMLKRTPDASLPFTNVVPDQLTDEPTAKPSANLLGHLPDNDQPIRPNNSSSLAVPLATAVGAAAVGAVAGAALQGTKTKETKAEAKANAEAELVVKTAKQRKAERELLAEAINEKIPEGVEEYSLPPIELLTESEDVCYDDQLKEVRRKAKVLEKTFADFGFDVKVVEIETGPVIAQYEVELEPGLRLSKITGLADDLAIALRVPSVRIVAPIPGKNTVGIEVPNEIRQVVRVREVVEESAAGAKKLKIPIFLGKDVSGGPMVVDLASMPHLLIAGRTGTGKSVCLNAIICSILMTRRPDEVRMLMIDPKMVELSGYARLPHLMHPVVTDMRKAEAILAWAVEKMEERYSLLARVGVRHIASYNQLSRPEILKRLETQDAAEEAAIPDQLPYIVIVADEMADLMMTAGKEVEQHIIRLAQKSRAVGIHLILATQKPTVDVITGLIKSNLPARLCFQVASKTDSRVVLDENGADKLLGNGDMLFLWPGTSTMIRGQGTYLSDQEIEAIVEHCSTGEQNFVGELMNLQVKDHQADSPATQTGGLKKRDDVYEAAVEVVLREGRGSVSLLQRALGIGYGRAARLIDFMAEDGIVGDYNGSQAREVAISPAQWESMRNGNNATAIHHPPSPFPAGPHRSLSSPANSAVSALADLRHPAPWEQNIDGDSV